MDCVTFVTFIPWKHSCQERTFQPEEQRFMVGQFAPLVLRSVFKFGSDAMMTSPR